MSVSDDEREARRRTRGSWPGGLLRLEELPEAELVPGTPSERIAMVTERTRAAWAMKGKPTPVFARSEDAC